jgi:hypothetical protein
VILHVVFDHIDQVRLEANDLELRDNSAPTRGDLFIIRDMSGYGNVYRATAESLDLVRSLPINVRLECTNPIRDVIDVGITLIERDGTAVIVTPNFVSANLLENTV